MKKLFILFFLLLSLSPITTIATDLPTFPDSPNNYTLAIFWDTNNSNFSLITIDSYQYNRILAKSYAYEGSDIEIFKLMCGDTLPRLAFMDFLLYDLSSDGQTWEFVGSYSELTSLFGLEMLFNVAEIREFDVETFLYLPTWYYKHFETVEASTNSKAYYVDFQIYWKQIFWYAETPDWLPESEDGSGDSGGGSSSFDDESKGFLSGIYDNLKTLLTAIVDLPLTLIELLYKLFVFLFVPDLENLMGEFELLYDEICEIFALDVLIRNFYNLQNLSEIAMDYTVSVTLFGQVYVVDLLNEKVTKYLIVNLRAFIYIFTYLRLTYFVIIGMIKTIER